MLSLTATIPSVQEKMVKVRQQAGGPDPVQRQNLSKKTPDTLRPVVGGTDPTPKKIPLLLMVGGIDPTPRKVYNHLAMDDDQTKGHGDTTNGYSDGSWGAANGG